MQTRIRPELTINDLELWTLDDAEAWNAAENRLVSEVRIDDDPLLDDDLLMAGETPATLSIRGLERLGIRVS